MRRADKDLGRQGKYFQRQAVLVIRLAAVNALQQGVLLILPLSTQGAAVSRTDERLALPELRRNTRRMEKQITISSLTLNQILI